MTSNAAIVIQRQPDFVSPFGTTEPESLLSRRTDLKRLKHHTDSSGAREAGTAVVAPERHAWLPWILMAMLVAGSLAWIVASRSRPTFQNPLSNAQFTQLTNFGGAKTNPAMSPDGKFVAFISGRSGKFDIWLIQANGSGLVNLTPG